VPGRFRLETAEGYWSRAAGSYWSRFNRLMRLARSISWRNFFYTKKKTTTAATTSSRKMNQPMVSSFPLSAKVAGT
jgi:hypothetical protein